MVQVFQNSRKHYLPPIILICSSIIVDHHFSIFQLLYFSLLTFTVQSSLSMQRSQSFPNLQTTIIIPCIITTVIFESSQFICAMLSSPSTTHTPLPMLRCYQYRYAVTNTATPLKMLHHLYPNKSFLHDNNKLHH